MSDDDRQAPPPAAPAPPEAGDPPARRGDLEGGLRFLHVLGMQARITGDETSVRLEALVQELAARSLIDLRRLDARREALKQAEGGPPGTYVQVAPAIDKYTLTDLPDIDCAARLPLCKARCCSFTFPLSFQDLDERVVRWDYAQPYHIARGPSGYCVHNDGEHHCTVYSQRPAVCRTYDCRQDKRVWIDFEARIPAPFEPPGEGG